MKKEVKSKKKYTKLKKTYGEHKNRGKDYIKLKKEYFNCGSPYSCWLKEQIIGELENPSKGLKSRGLLKKYGINRSIYEASDIVSDGGIKKLDDYPPDLRKIAVEIIRIELDPDFER